MMMFRSNEGASLIAMSFEKFKELVKARTWE